MDSEKKYLKERVILEEFIRFENQIIKSFENKKVNNEMLYILCSIVHIIKQTKSIVILYDNGLYEGGQSILRNVYEIVFRCVALIKDTSLLNNYIEKFYKNKESLLNTIINNSYDEYMSKEEAEKRLADVNACLKATKELKINELAKKADLLEEYMHYKLLCNYTHFDIGIIGSIVEETSDGFLLNADSIEINLHHEYGKIVGILIKFLNEVVHFINNDELENIYKEMTDKCDEIW